jgi:pterin-4a-carbinolamine dehydratase
MPRTKKPVVEFHKSFAKRRGFRVRRLSDGWRIGTDMQSLHNTKHVFANEADAWSFAYEVACRSDKLMVYPDL